MYSFLKQQKQLNRIYWNRKTFYLAIENKITTYPKAYFLLRQPRERFLSYFKDKFRKEPLRMLEENRLTPNHLQRCQRLWLNHVGIPTRDVSACCYELLRTPADSVVDWLPSAYTRDCHTIPQMYSLYARWRSLRIKLRVDSSFLIDRAEDIEKFSKLTGLDTSRKINHTENVGEPVKLSRSSSTILQKLYACDSELISSIKRF